MNNKSLRSVLVLLVLFPVLVIAISTSVQAAPPSSPRISIDPHQAIANSPAVINAKLDTNSTYFSLNITIPAGYNFILPAAGNTVGNYTMINKTANKDQVIINIASNNTSTETVDVSFSTNYGMNYSTKLNQSIANMNFGVATFKLTKPNPTTPGFLNISLGGAGPILPEDKVIVKLAKGVLRNPGTEGDYTWVLEAHSIETAESASFVVHIIATPSPHSSENSGSGSTGGGGVTTPEPFQNIVTHETRDCNVLSDKPSSCKFSVPEHWVSELVVTDKENEIVTFRIEALKGLSSKVPIPAPGTQYLNIWPDSKRIQDALIRFRVENSWIESEGLTSENLRMYRWDGKIWNELETRVLSKDASATNFEAKTDAFAYFAITGVKTATPKAATTIAVPTGMTPSASVTALPLAQQPISLVYIIILIGVIAVVAYLYARKHEKK